MANVTSSSVGHQRATISGDSGRRLLGVEIPATPLAASLIVAGLVAALVYGRAAGYVYSEDSIFALEFGHHRWYHALTFGQIVGKYFSLAHGWYRPTGFYLIPYLLHIDYFQPSEQITLDIATMVIAAVMITVFFRRLRVLTAVTASLLVLLAPALYQVTYGVQADSFYIIFGLGFLWLADRLYFGDFQGWRRVAMWSAVGIALVLTITTKEVGCIVVVLLIPFLLLRGPHELTAATVRKVVKFASPLVLAVGAYGIILSIQINVNNQTYSSQPHLSKVLNVINLISWTLGFRSPHHTFTNWVPHWSSGETIAQAAILAIFLGGLVATWRRFRVWRIALFASTVVGTAVAIALAGGIPYHAYPLVIMYGIAFLAVTEALADRIGEMATGSERLRALRGMAPVVLVVLIVTLVYQGHATYGGVVANGPQSAFLQASTELFDGSTLAPVRHATNPLFVFQDCLGGLENPLKFYARAATGTQIIVPGVFSYAAVQPSLQRAYQDHRPAFVALCTGSNDPWYVLRQYGGRTRGLLPAVP